MVNTPLTPQEFKTSFKMDGETYIIKYELRSYDEDDEQVIEYQVKSLASNKEFIISLETTRHLIKTITDKYNSICECITKGDRPSMIKLMNNLTGVEKADLLDYVKEDLKKPNIAFDIARIYFVYGE